MSIGETLAQARREAGLSIEYVSRRTRIRETIIRGIERDDFSPCRGDFYARGHIRAIARVVGTDSGPLIEEYDATQSGEGAEWFSPGLVKEPRTSGWSPEPSGQQLGEPVAGRDPGEPLSDAYLPQPDTDAYLPQPDTDAYLPQPDTDAYLPQPDSNAYVPEPAPEADTAGPVTEPDPGGTAAEPDTTGPLPEPGSTDQATEPTVGQPLREPGSTEPVTAPSTGPATESSTESSTGTGTGPARHAAPRRPAAQPAPGARTARAGRAGRRGVNWSAVLGLAVLLAAGFAGYLLLSGGGHTQGTSAAAAHRAGTGSGARHTPSAKPAPSTPAPTPSGSPPVQALKPVSISAFGPGGPGQGDNPQLARFALDDNAATPWHSDWYATAAFGNLQPGTGLLLDMGHSVTVTGAEIALGNAAGADIELRVGGSPALAGLDPAAHGTDVGGTVRLHPATPAHGRYVLVWFTKLPRDQSGTFQASVYSIQLRGHS